MRRIGIPEGMTLSGVVCLTRVDTAVLEQCTEFHLEGFTRGFLGDILDVDIVLAATSSTEAIQLLRGFSEGAMFLFRNEPFSLEERRISLLHPKLFPWDAVPFDLCMEDEHGKDLPMNDRDRDRELELIARRIANRSKRQRHYFDDDEDVCPSRKVKGLWIYGRETYGLEKMFIYVPARSEIPIAELSQLLSRIDGKLERAGSFKRIVSTYGNIMNETGNNQGAFIKGQFKIDVDQWRVALTMLTEPGSAPIPIHLTTFRVPYQHAFGVEATTRPRINDPVIIVIPHRHLLVSEKALKVVRALHKNLTWVFYDADQGWSMETTLSWINNEAPLKDQSEEETSE